MKTTIEQFEEIWPVPEGVYWHEEASGYWTNNHTYEDSMDEWGARLDTFTRCQETTAIHLSLIDELVQELESMTAGIYAPSSDEVIGRAKQKLEQIK